MAKIMICGSEVTVDELREDVKAARKRGLSQKWAFTPETVSGLLDAIEQLHEEVETIRRQALAV